MISSQKFLEKCSRLKDKNIFTDFSQGYVIARGFADFGFEEFIMLTSDKICSLYNGKISELPEEEKKHFFSVPDADQLKEKIIKAGLDIVSLDYTEQRIWTLKVSEVNHGKNQSFFSDSLKGVFLECLLCTCLRTQ